MLPNLLCFVNRRLNNGLGISDMSHRATKHLFLPFFGAPDDRPYFIFPRPALRELISNSDGG